MTGSVFGGNHLLIGETSEDAAIQERNAEGLNEAMVGKGRSFKDEEKE